MRTVNVALIATVGVAVICLIFLSVSANGDTIVVNQGGTGDYTTIQEAANNAVNGDTIEVHAGTYVENVRLYSEVILKSDGGTVTIDGRNDAGIHIYGNNTVVTGMSVVNASNAIYAHNNSFTIQNVTIDSCTAYDGSDPGITLFHVNNSRISGCRAYNNTNDGIMLDHCSNSIVIGCELSENGRSGIYVWNSEHNAILDCEVLNDGTGILISTGNGGNIIANCTISKNTYYGIDINTSVGNTVEHSSVNQNLMTGINLYGGADSTVIDGCSVWGNGHGGIDVYSEENTVSECFILGNGMNGVLFSDGHNNTLKHTDSIQNDIHGIYLWEANGNQIINSRSHGNSADGLNVLDSNNNTVTNTTFSENSEYGISISINSLNNKLFHNSLELNDQNAKDNGTNIWDNGSPSGGNTWSDYDEEGEGAVDMDKDGFADDPYIIPGSGNQDQYPFVSFKDTIPPVAEAGEDQMIQQFIRLTLNGSGSTDNIGITTYSWSFNDSGSVILSGVKPTYVFNYIGSYLVNLTVFDAEGNNHTDSMWVYVTESSTDFQDPMADAGSDQIVLFRDPTGFNGGGSTDNKGVISYTWTFDDGGLRILNGKAVEYTFKRLGTFIVTLMVQDIAGNFDIDTVNITVVAHPNTGNLTGQTKDTEGDIISDADVILTGTDNVYTTTVGPSGRYTFFSIPNGTYSIFAENVYREGKGGIFIETGQTHTLDLVLERKDSKYDEGNDDPPFVFIIILMLIIFLFLMITKNMLKKDTEFKESEEKSSDVKRNKKPWEEEMEEEKERENTGINENGDTETKKGDVEKLITSVEDGRGVTEQGLEGSMDEIHEDPPPSPESDDDLNRSSPPE